MCKNIDKYLEQIQKVSPFYNNVNHIKNCATKFATPSSMMAMWHARDSLDISPFLRTLARYTRMGSANMMVSPQAAPLNLQSENIKMINVKTPLIKKTVKL